MNPSLDRLQKKLHHRFKDPGLLEAALTHRSYRHEHRNEDADNQRLEFLGDAALGIAAAARLYERHPTWQEGDLTRARSRLTNTQTLAQVAEALDLGPLLRLGRGELQSGGQTRSSNLADAMEAVLGAVYLDGGLRSVRKVFRALFEPRHAEDREVAQLENPKGRLLELCQKRTKSAPVYVVTAESGPAHERSYAVEVRLDGATLGSGSGSSKRQAEMAAAAEALRRMGR